MVKCETNFRGTQKSFGMLSKLEPGFANRKSKFLFITGLLILSVNSLLAQYRDSIHYTVPADVKTKILDYVKQKGSRSGFATYGILSFRNDTTEVLVSHYGESPKELVFLINNSNRYIKLNSTEVIPILLGSDLLFSDLLHTVKNEGDPYAIFSHKFINVSGYLIEFQGLYDKARLINASYFQY